MAKIEDCSHVELYEISFWDIELSGSKIIFMVYLNDMLEHTPKKTVSLSISNIAEFLKDAEIDNAKNIVRKCLRCLMNQSGEVNYVSLNNEWFVCKDLTNGD